MKINVVAHPNSKKPRIITDLLENIHIYVNEPPLEGKANNAIREALSKHYSIPKSHIKLIQGDNAKHKVFEI